MGREIRRVPPNWQHPKTEQPNHQHEECYQPMRDQDAETAWADWQEEYAAWLAGEHDRVITEYGSASYPKNEPYRAFCTWHGQPPDPKYYRPTWAEGSATWWQVYETVSEGTPVTPPFETAEELIDYLCTHGDFWDQNRGSGPWSREAAEKFVGVGWAPSMMMMHTAGGVTIKQPRDGI